VYAGRFIDPAWGFAIGWSYALQMLIGFPLILTSAAMTIQYWDQNAHTGIWTTVFFVIACVINLVGVEGYGEFEFFISIFKIIAVVGFIIVSIGIGFLYQTNCQ
jgi:yeast amino acid transporter